MAKPSSDQVQQSTLCDKGGDAKFGCSHYTRKCRLVAPCCGKIYSCRLVKGSCAQDKHFSLQALFLSNRSSSSRRPRHSTLLPT